MGAGGAGAGGDARRSAEGSSGTLAEALKEPAPLPAPVRVPEALGEPVPLPGGLLLCSGEPLPLPLLRALREGSERDAEAEPLLLRLRCGEPLGVALPQALGEPRPLREAEAGLEAEAETRAEAEPLLLRLLLAEAREEALPLPLQLLAAETLGERLRLRSSWDCEGVAVGGGEAVKLPLPLRRAGAAARGRA